ncbi:MAG: hypothetical protein Q7R98_03125 [Candidatus Jorgensenbacteria bacterium]|nr:hypothetical protein [Candidatus Jorgensenbacteria bacterium]
MKKLKLWVRVIKHMEDEEKFSTEEDEQLARVIKASIEGIGIYFLDTEITDVTVQVLTACSGKQPQVTGNLVAAEAEFLLG